MKNPLKLIWYWILKQFRKKEVKKREKVYDDVIDILGPKLKEKSDKQNQLIKEITTNFKKDLGVSYESKFIPNHFVDAARVIKVIHAKYGEKMNELGVKLTHDLRLVCI